MSNPAASFEPYRRRLLGLAYRMLGSMADAEDAVQETYLRWHGADRDNVSDPRAFLMTTTTRICLDMLTSARARREEYSRSMAAGAGCRHGSARARQPHGAGRGSVHRAALDARPAVAARARCLPAARRVRFLVQRSGLGTGAERGGVPAACRPRPRARARSATTRRHRAAGASGEIDAKHAQLMSAFAAATESGDLNALTQLLASDVRVVTDGGGKVRAALNVVDGADRAARFLVDVTRKRPGAVVARRLHGALCDHQRPARCHRGRTRGTGADGGVRD